MSTVGPSRVPSVHWLAESQLGHDSFQSTLLSLLRGVAAIEVAAAHLRAEMFPGIREVEDPAVWYTGLAFFTGFAHQAVLVFFLISGWLVGGSLLNKIRQPKAFRSYTIDRVTRLWTVLIPTFLLVLLFAIARNVDPTTSNEYAVTTLVGNLVGLQTIVVPNYGGNYSLWSLANETWYYVLFPLSVLFVVSRRYAVRAACAVAILLIAGFVPRDILLFFSVWLLGVLFSRIRIDAGPIFRMSWLLLVVAVSVYYRLNGITDDLNSASYVQDIVCSLVFAVFLSSWSIQTDPSSAWLKQLGRASVLIAGFSFTLYVIHAPLIQMIRYASENWLGRAQLAPCAWSALAIYMTMLAITIVASYVFFLMFESHTYAIRRMARERFL